MGYWKRPRAALVAPVVGATYIKGRQKRRVDAVEYQLAMFGEQPRFNVYYNGRKRPSRDSAWCNWMRLASRDGGDPNQ